MTVTASSFRAIMPEFASTDAYPDSLVTTWLSVAEIRIDPYQWGTLTDTGVALCAAHMLVLAKRAGLSAAAGGIPGGVSGPTSSKTVDKVSVSYDTGATTIEGDGHWNATTYGLQFFELARMFGSGGYQA